MSQAARLVPSCVTKTFSIAVPLGQSRSALAEPAPVLRSSRGVRDKVAGMSEAPQDPDLHAAIETLLLDRGALTVAELVDALSESDFDLGREPESSVLDVMYESFGAPFTRLDSRWAHLPALLSGRIFGIPAPGGEGLHGEQMLRRRDAHAQPGWS